MNLCVTVQVQSFKEYYPCEAFRGKCDSFERDIIIGRFRSFSTIVIFGVLFASHLPMGLYWVLS